MKKLIAALSILIISVSMIPPSGSREVLKKMLDRFAGKWYKTLSFNQTTEVYRNDSLVRTETWYENIKFPTDFRIDFGDTDSGKAVVYKNDSAFFFRNGKIAGVRPDENDLLFLLGGMYFYKFDEVISKMKSYGYDLEKFHEDNWRGKEVYVIGAGKGEDSVNQLWIEKKNLSPVRMIKFGDNNKEEAYFENHVGIGGGYTETLVHFFINGKLIQVEKYHDLKANEEIDSSIFDTKNFMKLKL